MEIYQLQSFLMVAHEGNVTRAADALCLSQPAVTRQVLALEREAGVPLFDRTGKGVTLTEAGAVLQRHARRVVAAIDECRQEIDDLRLGAAGRVVLAVGVRHEVSEWLPEFQERYPNAELVVYTRGTREVLQLLLDRQVDLGLVVHPEDHPELRAVRLYEEDVVLVVSPGHALAAPAVRFEDLRAVPLVLWARGSDFGGYIESAFTEAGVPMLVRAELDNVEEIKRLVAAGFGATLLPESIAKDEASSGALALARVEGPRRLARETCVVHRVDRYLSTAARGLLNLLLARHGKPSERASAQP